MTSQTSSRALTEAAARGLRSLAADDRCREAFTAPGSLLQNLLSPAAHRYVLAAGREEFLDHLATLRAKGYLITVEFVGEENSDPGQIEQVVQEYLALLGHEPVPEQLGFDLSNVGLAVSRDLALRNTARIVEAAADRGCTVVLSMERSPTVDTVLGVYRELAERYDNIGITLQAHLHRTEQDLAAVAAPGRKVRLVKGAFQEAAEVAVRRGPALDERYLRFAEELVGRGVRLSLATQDPAVLAAAKHSGLLDRVAEIEMLHGVQPHLLRSYREAGHACRIYATYGENWWLHLLHRLAEHPPMVLTALADLGDDTARAVGADY
ncbi:L-proline dehydrogenase [Streptomyces sp. 1222.5]|uniref:proline dehydrogenase family protein n=1 Tax=unclassified Streptomyces TaxID=2593676 RepID=UPI0008953B79|nr:MULTISPECIES: proline dehydrogenase family protein [unclassified Streptomyces]PKW00389.1 L-proline dehydrogenase [Streptomyces sp. 5112.2]SED86864.1 L-proline dehydrogenase [Streptomyces sp. 1222.5]